MPLEKLKRAVLRGASKRELSPLVTAALKTRKYEKIISLLEKHLKHENPSVRLAAMHALEKTGHPKAASLIELLRKDADENVRKKAKKTLREIRSLEDVELLHP